MAAVLSFPSPPDARVCADLRHLAQEHGLRPHQVQRVVSRFLRVASEGRSNAVAVMEARRVMREAEVVGGECGGAA